MALHEVTLAIARQPSNPQGATAEFLQGHPEEYEVALQSFLEAQAIWQDGNQFPGAPVIHEGHQAWARPVAGNGTYEIIVNGKVVKQVDAAEAIAKYVYMMFRE
ncbi:MAG: hypothetical protein HYS86_03305 [Candidatus Chisholmbacteria bacterium]|nr:hypothetical protein [Candidatus Chisholmbacteria bacterium]